jgi:hypothetical protein
MVVGARGLVRTVARVLGVRDDFVGVRGELQAAAARDGSAGASSRFDTAQDGRGWVGGSQASARGGRGSEGGARGGCGWAGTLEVVVV